MFKEGPPDGRVDVSEVRGRRSHLEVQPNIALQLLARVRLVFAEHSSNTDLYWAERDVQLYTDEVGDVSRTQSSCQPKPT